MGRPFDSSMAGWSGLRDARRPLPQPGSDRLFAGEAGQQDPRFASSADKPDTDATPRSRPFPGAM